MNFARLIDDTCQGAPSTTALIIGDEQISYGELGAQIGCVASSLRRLGVQPGDRLALLMPNSFEYLVSYYALLKMGAVAVPLNPLLREPEVHYIMEDCQASGLIFHQEFAPIIEALRNNLSSLRHTILVGDKGGAETQTFKDLLQMGDQESSSVDRDDQDLATLIYTSGMTGDPKGAMLSHRGLIASAEATVEGFQFRPTDCIIGVLPFAHIFGKNLLVQAALVAGASVVVMARFNSALVVEAIERWKATALSGVPLMLIALSNALEAQPRDVSTLRKCMVGGTTVPMEVVRRFEGLFSHCEVVEAYGISENTGIVTLNPLGGSHHLGTTSYMTAQHHVTIQYILQAQASQYLKYVRAHESLLWQLRPSMNACLIYFQFLNTSLEIPVPIISHRVAPPHHSQHLRHLIVYAHA